MFKIESKNAERYIEFTVGYQADYGGADYELELSIPYSLISHLIGFECTPEVAKKFLFVEELTLGEIEGKHSCVEIDVYCNRESESPKFIITHDFMYERFMEDFLDCIEIDDSNYDTDDEFAAFLRSEYKLETNEELLETLKEILEGYFDGYVG